jgi:hypothetical protein
MCPHSTCATCVHVVILYICPHIIYASYYICLILYMPHITYVSTCYRCDLMSCPDTIYMSSYYIYPRIHTPTYTPTYLPTHLHTYILYMSSYTIHLSSLHVVMLYAPAHYVCVLILLHVCYYYSSMLLYMCVLILLHVWSSYCMYQNHPHVCALQVDHPENCNDSHVDSERDASSGMRTCT